jgi:hypothetical protein
VPLNVAGAASTWPPNEKPENQAEQLEMVEDSDGILLRRLVSSKESYSRFGRTRRRKGTNDGGGKKQRVKKARMEIEKKEEKRQRRKLEFLITQTELYSHFVGKRLKSE